MDARASIKHDTFHYEKIDDLDYSHQPARAIIELKKNGRVPTYESLYNKESKSLVEKLFRDDIEFFKKRFGEKRLLFS